MRTDSLFNEGAEIVYDVEGDGPLLLLIQGGGGDSERYAAIGARLSDTYTVVRYDRRGNFRSELGAAPQFDIAQQARDAAALIRRLGEHALVFGNSGGGIIGLQLTAAEPDVVDGFVCHEPPLWQVLPDAAEIDAWNAEVWEVVKSQGIEAAFRYFTRTHVGMEEFHHERVPDDEHVKNDKFFLGYEFPRYFHMVPDLDALARFPRRMAFGAGLATEDAYYARSARVLAERLDARYFEFPGHHVAFVDQPDAFVEVLRNALSYVGEEVGASRVPS